jgi:hypothetical protein
MTLAAGLFILGSLLPEPPVSTAHPVPAPATGVLLAMTEDRLSLTTIATPWPLVLGEFRRRTGVALRVVPAPVGALTVSIDNVRVEAALRLLFGADAGFVYVYRPGPPGAPAVLAEMLIMAGRSAGPAAALDPSRISGRHGSQTPITSTAEARDEAADGADDDSAASLRAEDPEARLKALDAIVERGGGSGVAEIRHLLATDPDLDVRTRAVRVLARVATPEALEALGQGLADPEMTVRLSAVDVIATFGTGRARALLRDAALRDRDEQVREVAAAALQSLRRGGP